jgi:drug/metabolite transporter (DMT)-like permease
VKSEDSNYRLGFWLALLAAAGFSGKAIFVKLSYGAAPVDAVTLLALRLLYSLPVFLWVAFDTQRNGPPLTRRDWLMLGALGLLGYYGASIFDFLGLQYITAGLERLILFTYPTLTVLIGVVFMGKSFSRREMGALLLSYAGIGLAFVHDLRLAGEPATVILGGALVFGSSLCYAFYLAGSAPAIARLGAMRFSALATIVSTGATVLHQALAQPLEAYLQPLPVHAYALGMALISTVMPVFAQSAAIARIGSSRSVLVGTVGPMLTIFLGWIVLDEALSLPQLLGAALVLAGVLLVTRR